MARHGGLVRILRYLLGGIAIAVVAGGCGGSDAETSGEQAIEPAAATTAAEPQVQQVEQRPDWLPVWVLLPEGLEVTLDTHDPVTGEAGVTGFILGADPQLLFDQAQFSVQSGGYLIGDVSENERSKSFNAEHTSNGRSVRFGVTSIDDETTQWSLEFSGLTAG